MKTKIKNFYKNLFGEDILKAYYHPKQICKILNLNYHELRKSDIKELEKFRSNFINEHKNDIKQSFLIHKFNKLYKEDKIEEANNILKYII